MLMCLASNCVGYFDGKREELEDIIERFLLSFTCYVKKDLHSREKDHKRFLKSDRLIAPTGILAPEGQKPEEAL